ncbi:MAG TPA: PAS domain S-box protein, partial [Geoalkalibacter subterraneus]|nr:PAS domain S-box protein [Geoalkalibacter subterraneus]
MKSATKSSPKPRSLSSTLALALFSLSAVLLLLYAGMDILSDFKIQETVLSRRQQVIAQEAARTVNNFINENFSILETAIWLTDLDKAPGHEQRKILQSLLGLRPAFRQVVLLNDHNQVLARASRLSTGASEQFIARVDDHPAGQNDAQIERTISPVYIDPLTSEPMATMGVPVTDVFGDFKGKLIAEINLKAMWDLVEQLKVGEAGCMYVCDRKGSLLAFKDTARVLKGENLSHIKAVADFIQDRSRGVSNAATRHEGIQGTTVVGMYTPLEMPDWAVITELPWKEAYRETLLDIAVAAGMALALAVLVGIVGLFISRRLAAPVIGLTETATRIAAGEIDLQASLRGSKEVAGLAVAFNSMTTQLHQSLKDLELRFGDLKQAEEALRISEERLRLALEGTSDGIWDWDPRTGHVYFSPRYYTMLGYEPDEFPHTFESWRRLLHPDDAEAAEQAARNTVEENIPFDVEFRCRAKDGQWRWILARGKVVETDREGRSVRVTGSHVDITESKQAEEALRREKHFADTLIDGMPGLFYVFDQQGSFVRWNKRFEKITGYTPEEIGRMRPTDLFGGKERDLKAKKTQNVFTKGEAEFEAGLMTRDGRTIPHHFTGLLIEIDGRPHLMGSAFDITVRKRAEEALEKRIVALTMPMENASGIRFEDLFNLDAIQRLQDAFAGATGVASLITREDGTPITQPSRFCRLCRDIIQSTDKGLSNCRKSDAEIGLASAEGPIILPCLNAGLWDACTVISIGGKHIANWGIGQVRTEDQTDDRVREYAREIEVDEEAAVEAFHEVPVMSKKHFRRVANLLFELADQISMTAYQNLQQARFITDRKQAEEALRKYERIVSSSPDLVALVNKDYVYEVVNESYLRYRNKRREEVIGHTVPQVMGEWVFREKIKPWLDQAFSGYPIHHREIVDQAANGRRILMATGFPMMDEEGDVARVVLNIRDITEIRKLQEQLMQSQKIESIGTLAGGVAHEINNPINGIMNYAQLIMDRTEEESPARAFAREILIETDRIAGIVRNLLTFARHEKKSHSPALISDIISAVLSLIRTVMRHDQIDLQVRIPDDLPKIKCRSQQIQQVLMNLMTNARDALNERYPDFSPGKRLRISAEEISKQGRRFIRTTVEDAGGGIPPAIRE